MHVYSRDLAGDSAYGGLTGFSKGSSVTIPAGSGFDYFPYTAPISPSASYARLGLMPTSSSNMSGDRPISSFLHLMKKIWITGIYLNTPFCPRHGSMTGNLFQWGVNSYVDVQVRSQSGWESVYRIGNPNANNADSYGFPSSTSITDSNRGIRITFPANEWKFVDGGTSMADIVRFNFFAGVTGTPCVWIINESTDGARDAEIDGYITFVQEHPLAT